MTRLPTALRPLWPAVKRSHRAATRAVGRTTRALPPRGERSVPREANETSAQSAALEPDHVRLHRVAPAETIDRGLPAGDPPSLRFWDDVRVLRSPERYVLEVADGRLVGDYAATITPAGRLDFQTSPYFGIRGWREHPVYLRTRLPEATHYEGTVVSLASQASGRNYYHSLMDAHPRWGLLIEALGEVKPDHIVVAHRSRWDAQLVEMAGLDAYSLIEPVKHLSLRADRLLVPALTNHSTLAPPWITQWLRRTFPPGDLRGRPKRIYVTRGSTPNTRRFVREAELLRLLEPFGFVRFDPGSVPVQEQIDTFAAAEAIVAPHGAGLTNLNFAAEGTRLLELFAPRYLNAGYRTIAHNIPGVVYRYLVAEPHEPDRGEARMNRIQADIDLAPDRVLRAVEEMLES